MKVNGIEYKDQRLEDLFFHVIPGAVDPERFTVVQSGVCQHGKVHARYHILRESHMIQFQASDFCLSEVVSCTSILGDLALGSAPTCCNRDFTTKMPVGGGQGLYSFQANRLNCERDVGALQAFLNAGVDMNRLDFQFPAQDPPVDASHCPRTIVDVQRINQGMPDASTGIVARTLHVYPQHGDFLTTQSRFIWRSSDSNR